MGSKYVLGLDGKPLNKGLLLSAYDDFRSPETYFSDSELIGPPATIVKDSCQTCVHRSTIVRSICVAFPDGIPERILMGKVSHKKRYKGDHGILKPYKGDHGIQYEKE